MTSLADFLMRNRLDALEDKPEYTTADVNALMPKPAWESPLAGLGSYQWSREAGAEPNWFGRNVLSNISPEAMHAANFLVPGAKALPRVPNPIKAYHGSPHDFDKFDLSKIGTGEGSQAYGHGLYFAEHPGVAMAYKQERPSDYRDTEEVWSRPGDRRPISSRRPPGPANPMILTAWAIFRASLPLQLVALALAGWAALAGNNLYQRQKGASAVVTKIEKKADANAKTASDVRQSVDAGKRGKPDPYSRR